MSKNRLPRRHIHINGKQKLYSHYVWHAHTGHWPIFPDEVVHHIDGDTTNDEFSNLQLMSDSEHKSLHNSGENHYNCSGENHPFFGKTHTEESIVKMIKAKLGEGNPNWQGDAASNSAKRNRKYRQRKRLNIELRMRDAGELLRRGE